MWSDFYFKHAFQNNFLYTHSYEHSLTLVLKQMCFHCNKRTTIKKPVYNFKDKFDTTCTTLQLGLVVYSSTALSLFSFFCCTFFHSFIVFPFRPVPTHRPARPSFSAFHTGKPLGPACTLFLSHNAWTCQQRRHFSISVILSHRGLPPQCLCQYFQAKLTNIRGPFRSVMSRTHYIQYTERPTNKPCM